MSPARLRTLSSRGGEPCEARRCLVAVAEESAAGTSHIEFQGAGEVADVEELAGVRVVVDGADGRAAVEYLVRWKVGRATPQTRRLNSRKPAVLTLSRKFTTARAARQDGSPDTWEAAENVADDVLREFEDRWWSACRTGNDEVLKAMLKGGARTLAHTVDENRRRSAAWSATCAEQPCNPVCPLAHGLLCTSTLV